MNEQIETEKIVDEAIESYPLAELPSNFTFRVMAEVNNRPQVAMPEKFRLDYLDFLIPGFLVLFFVIVTAVLTVFFNLNFDITQLGSSFSLNSWRSMGVVAVLFFEMCLGVIAYFYLWSERY